MKYLMIPLVALLASPGAYAACSAADVEAAAERLAERVAQLTENDPERAA